MTARMGLQPVSAWWTARVRPGDHPGVDYGTGAIDPPFRDRQPSDRWSIGGSQSAPPGEGLSRSLAVRCAAGGPGTYERHYGRMRDGPYKSIAAYRNNVSLPVGGRAKVTPVSDARRVVAVSAGEPEAAQPRPSIGTKPADGTHNDINVPGAPV